MNTHEADRKVLDVLAAQGSDLTKPAHTGHYLYFKSEIAARTAAGELRASGCERVDVRPAPTKSVVQRLPGPREFACIAETHAVPSDQNVCEASAKLKALAARHRGVYDGWEASVEK